MVVDPVASGIVPRLDRPGGNITGFATLEGSLGGKWLGLLSEIAPGLSGCSETALSRYCAGVMPAARLHGPNLDWENRHTKAVLAIDVLSAAGVSPGVAGNIGRIRRANHEEGITV
jgi:hypothetical protein